MLSCKCSLCILDINHLSLISFADMFSPSTGCLLILLMISFAMQNLLSLLSPHSIIFAFVSFAQETDPKRYCYNLFQRVFCPSFSIGVLCFQDLKSFWAYFYIWMCEFYAALKLLISLDHVKSNPTPLLLFTFIGFIETWGTPSYRGLSQTNLSWSHRCVPWSQLTAHHSFP